MFKQQLKSLGQIKLEQDCTCPTLVPTQKGLMEKYGLKVVRKDNVNFWSLPEEKEPLFIGMEVECSMLYKREVIIHPTLKNSIKEFFLRNFPLRKTITYHEETEVANSSYYGKSATVSKEAFAVGNTETYMKLLAIVANNMLFPTGLVRAYIDEFDCIELNFAPISKGAFMRLSNTIGDIVNLMYLFGARYNTTYTGGIHVNVDIEFFGKKMDDMFMKNVEKYYRFLYENDSFYTALTGRCNGGPTDRYNFSAAIGDESLNEIPMVRDSLFKGMLEGLITTLKNVAAGKSPAESTRYDALHKNNVRFFPDGRKTAEIRHFYSGDIDYIFGLYELHYLLHQILKDGADLTLESIALYISEKEALSLRYILLNRKEIKQFLPIEIVNFLNEN